MRQFLIPFDDADGTGMMLMEAATDACMRQFLIPFDDADGMALMEAATDAVICESWTSWKAPRLFHYGPMLVLLGDLRR